MYATLAIAIAIAVATHCANLVFQYYVEMSSYSSTQFDDTTNMQGVMQLYGCPSVRCCSLLLARAHVFACETGILHQRGILL